jgi:UMF1 family MFS transporter
MLYNDGIQTVIQMSAPYGKDLGISTDMLMITLLVTQILGAVGSFAFERIAHRMGTKPTIMISLVLLTGVVVFAYFIQTAREFLALGTVVGFAYGGSQALSRSYYSSMIPAEASAEFFGFYTVFSKFSSIWGTFFFGAATLAQGSARPAILGTAGFFIVGLTLLAFVNERKAQSVTQRTFS